MTKRRGAAAGVITLVAVPLVLMMVMGFFLAGGEEDTGQTATGCPVDVDTTGKVATLTDPEQIKNARTIIAVGVKLKVPRKGLIVAIATARQESGIRNLNYGDRDSLGLFQQRPVSGWGTPAQITNPELSAAAFYGQAQHTHNPGLLDIKGWEAMSIAEAAQAVQRSAFPAAYAQWAAMATTVVDEVTGGKAADVVPAGMCGSEQSTGAGCGKSTNLSGFQNGRIPASALCVLHFDPRHKLRADAAAAADQMAAAMKAATGLKLCVTDSYRDYETQVRLKREKGFLAATPGTSNHGWGQAMDLCGGINTGSGPAWDWMKANANRYGWIHPAWAEPGGSGPLEWWHWEYGVKN